MMYTLSCRDAGVDCDFVAKGETMDEVLETGMDHVKKTHPEKVKEMESMPKEKLLNLVKET